jgi:molybdopterin converting factor small subunit
MHVKVELWMWLGGKLGEDFQSPSEMRSAKGIEVEERITVIQLFDRLALQYPLIGEKIFSREAKKFNPNLSVIVTLNDQVISPFNLEENVLKDGCKITVLPYYAGG